MTRCYELFVRIVRRELLTELTIQGPPSCKRAEKPVVYTMYLRQTMKPVAQHQRQEQTVSLPDSSNNKSKNHPVAIRIIQCNTSKLEEINLESGKLCPP